MVKQEQKKEITSIIDNIKKDLKNIEEERNNLSNKYQIKLDSLNQIDKLISTSDNIVDALSEIENKLKEDKENTSLDLNKKLSTLFTYIKEQINKIEDKISTIKDEYQKIASENNKVLNEQASLLKEQYEKLSLENNQQLKNLEHKIEREAHIMSQIEKENISYRTAFNDIKAFEVSILQLDDLKQTVDTIKNIENNLKKNIVDSFEQQNNLLQNKLNDFSFKDIEFIKDLLNKLNEKIETLDNKTLINNKDTSHNESTYNSNESDKTENSKQEKINTLENKTLYDNTSDIKNNEDKENTEACDNKDYPNNKEFLDFINHIKEFIVNNEQSIKDSDKKLEKELIKVQQSLNELISSNNIDKIDIKNLLSKDDKDILKEIENIKEFMSIFSNQVIYKIDSQDRLNKKLMNFIYFIAIALSCTTLFSIASLFVFFFIVNN